jgi:hypothetical protein
VIVCGDPEALVGVYVSEELEVLEVDDVADDVDVGVEAKGIADEVDVLDELELDDKAATTASANQNADSPLLSTQLPVEALVCADETT